MIICYTIIINLNGLQVNAITNSVPTNISVAVSRRISVVIGIWCMKKRKITWSWCMKSSVLGKTQDQFPKADTVIYIPVNIALKSSCSTVLPKLILLFFLTLAVCKCW